MLRIDILPVHFFAFDDEFGLGVTGRRSYGGGDGRQPRSLDFVPIAARFGSREGRGRVLRIRAERRE